MQWETQKLLVIARAIIKIYHMGSNLTGILKEVLLNGTHDRQLSFFLRHTWIENRLLLTSSMQEVMSKDPTTISHGICVSCHCNLIPCSTMILSVFRFSNLPAVNSDFTRDSNATEKTKLLARYVALLRIKMLCLSL